jgi:hypothetical protein
MPTNGLDVGSLFISFGVDASSFTQELIAAEQQASGSATKIKDKLASVAGSLSNLRAEAKKVREALADSADFKVRGDAALDRLHDVLFKVRDAGAATDKTLDELSLQFEQASKGAHSYTQALDKVAADKSASQSVRDLARALSDEAKEANYSTDALRKRQAVLERQISQQSRTFTSTLKESRKQDAPPPPPPEEEEHAVPAQAAASAFVRAGEGQLSIRAAERFLGGNLGLGSAFQALFPIAGGLATLDILGNLVEKVQDWRTKLKEIEEQPQHIASAFRELNQATRSANDDLQITNDRLEEEIAKLQGKPGNGLALALDEARQAADKLAESIDKDLSGLEKLLKDQRVGGLAQVFGKAGTDDIAEQIKSFHRVTDQVTDVGAAQIPETETKPGLLGIRIQPDAKGANANNARTLESLQNTYRDKIVDLQRQLAEAERGQVPAAVDLTGTGAGQFSADTESRVTTIRKTIQQLVQEYQSAEKQLQNSTDSQKKDRLQSSQATTRLTAPYQDELKKLDAELAKLQGNLQAVGQTESMQILAKAAGAAREEIARLNKEQDKQHRPLSQTQEGEITKRFTQIEQTRAEEEFQKRFQSTTTSITERISSLNRLTQAIGQGYEAQKRVTVEDQLQQEFTKEFQDPKLLEQRRPQIEQRRQQLATQFDTQQTNQSATQADKLREQIAEEQTLAQVETAGAGALRTVTLAYQLRAEAEKSGLTTIRDQIDAEIALAAAEKRSVDLPKLQTQIEATPAPSNVTPEKAQQQQAAQQQLAQQLRLTQTSQAREGAATLAQLTQETEATTRLTQARVQGEGAVHQAELENRIEGVQRNSSLSPEDKSRQVEQIRQQDVAQRRDQIAQQATAPGNAYQDQVSSLSQQIAYLEEIKRSQGDSLSLEVSLKTLDEERTHILSEQALVFGTAKDGIHAYFDELRTQSVSSAQQMHDAFAGAIEGVNDQFARLISGQKVNFASLFQNIAAQLAKTTLQNAEASIAGKILQPSDSNQAQKTGGLSSVLSAILGKRENTQDVRNHPLAEPGGFTGEKPKASLGSALAGLGKRDGNSSATALYVTSMDGNGQASGSPNANPLASLPGAFGNPNLTKEDQENLGDFDPRELAQLAGGGDSAAETENVTSKITDTLGGLFGKLSGVLSGVLGKLGGGGGLGSLLGSLGGLFGGFFAEGGDVSGGKMHVVGENGPELFVPKADGTIIPNHRLGDLAKATGPSTGERKTGITSALTRVSHAHSNDSIGESNDFAGFFAEGGDVEKDQKHMVGEKGKEVFVPKTLRAAVGTSAAVPGKRNATAGFAALNLPKFGGYRATGGSVDPGNAYVVGEAGPELFSPMAAGSITPNSSLGGNSEVHYHVDARYSTNPEETARRTQAAILAAHNSAINKSYKAVQESKLRTPQV